mmetsp:Transcript_26115/g.39520  ORF Transcript_26115/g.39520 Transcript_26115/m.39520 type:complete len:199 (-) Transcript_26115:20-616(-)
MKFLSTYLTAVLILNLVSGDGEIEVPSVFHRRGKVQNCKDNAIVDAWCDSSVFEEIECGLLPEFDEYGCQCFRDPSKCPSECVGSNSELIEKSHYGIRCRNLPPDDSPNYILKEYHEMGGCEENSLVSAWCDDYVNRHLECGLFLKLDQYLCKCSGKATNCPLECIDGSEPLVKAEGSVLCNGIPVDSPNYVLKESKK